MPPCTTSWTRSGSRGSLTSADRRGAPCASGASPGTASPARAFDTTGSPGLGNLRHGGEGVQIADPTDIRHVLAELRAGQDVALLCACGKIESCHRRVVAELIRAEEPALRITHRTGGRADSVWVDHTTLAEEPTLF
jgi:hypothetical protein